MSQRFGGDFLRHHVVAVRLSLFSVMLLGVLDYEYRFNGCDLLWWRNRLATFLISPMLVLLYIAAGKATVILSVVLSRYICSAELKDPPSPEVMPISYVRRRYCRFILMQLLASVDELIGQPDPMDVEEYVERHGSFTTAVDLFRCQARKIFEHSDMHIIRPLQDVLIVDDELEEELINRGYDEGLKKLHERDIYRLVYDTEA